MDIYRSHYHSAKPPVTTAPIGSSSSSLTSTLPEKSAAQDQHRISKTLSDDSLSYSAKRAIKLKQYAWAIKLLDQLILRHPDKAIYFNNRGLVKLWMGQPRAALIDCTRAIRLDPDLDEAYNNRGNCYAALGLMAQAVADYELAVDLNPLNVKARINLGGILRDCEEFDEALLCFDEALIFYRLTERIYAERGRTYHLRGDWNCAIADYNRALGLIRDSELTSEHQRLATRIQQWLAELLPTS
jgi:tetratricopeptide (TPR) repeat protein